MTSARPAVAAIAAGTALFGVALGGVGTVGRDVAAADAQQRQQQDPVLVRDVLRDASPRDGRPGHHHSRREL